MSYSKRESRKVNKKILKEAKKLGLKIVVVPILLICCCVSVSAVPQVDIGITVPESVIEGEEFTVAVWMNPGSATVDAWVIHNIHYSNKVIRAISTEVGDFWNTTEYCSKGNIKNNIGVIEQAQAFKTTGTAENTTILLITFLAVEGGECLIYFDNIQCVYEGNELEVKDRDIRFSIEYSDNPPDIPPDNTTNDAPFAIIENEDYTVMLENSVTFNGDGSYDLDGEIVSYYWDFGDGEFGAGKIVEHIYHRLGNYTVILTVTDSDGMTAWDLALVHVYTLPEDTPDNDNQVDENQTAQGDYLLIIIVVVCIIIAILVIVYIFGRRYDL